MADQTRWGIRIVPTPDETHANRQRFELWATPFAAGCWFVTNSATSQAIAQQRLTSQKKVGHITFSFDHQGKRITTHDYYPVDQMASLKGLGIATLVELSIQKKLLRQYPHYSVLSRNNPQKARVDQLRKRGRAPGRAVLLKDDVKALQTRVKMNARRFKKPLPR